MTSSVAVVGANGRVGSAIVRHLAHHFDVTPIERIPDDKSDDVAARAAARADVVVNAAGVAHIETMSHGDLERLRVGNVELPIALAAASLARGISLVHISSVKATEPASSPYAASKREADDRLEREFGEAFAAKGTSIIVIRPLALLFPPLDAGKVARLRFLRRWPALLTPPLRLPVLSANTFLTCVERAIGSASNGGGSGTGFTLIEFVAADRGTLRDVRDAMQRDWEQRS